MSSPFVHLHVHSQYSLLEGAIRIPQLCERVKALGMDTVAMTDSANMFGAYEFFQTAKKHGVKPIFGAMVYYLTGGSLESRELKKREHFLANLVLLVQNAQGYRNLCELLSLAHLKGFYYKARLDKQVLSQYSEGLIALSGGIFGEVSQRLLREEKPLALEALDFLRSTFPDRFYLELQDHGLPLEKRLRPQLTELIQEQSIPLVLTNECKYLNQQDYEAQVVLTCIQTGRTLQEEHDRGETPTDQRFVKSPEQMAALFPEYPEAMTNSRKIADQCDFSFDGSTYHFPQFTAPAGLSLNDYFRQEVAKGFEERWEKLAASFFDPEIQAQKKAEYQDRLEEELNIIIEMGFPGYFLIVSDFINYAKIQGIPVGPGRGSAAGSLVAYALKITDIDPMPFHLLFERFLNPERISMPDMDIDFCMNRRDEVIRYVAQKYGHVAQIITFGKMKAKAVIRDVGRVLDIPYGEVDKIAKLIPNTLNITLEEALAQEPRLQEVKQSNQQCQKLMEIALALEGLTRHASMHAAGVVIADESLTHFCPLYKGPNNEVVTQFDMKSVESIGLVKFDFLGLKTLTVIESCLKIIEKTRGKKLDLSDVPLGDAEVYQYLCQGKGLGIFQLESSGMRDLLVRLKPNCFEDIIALVALYRPGPLGSGMVDDFINRKHGKTEISYDLNELRPILDSTYGVIVYQEQVMQIASVLADFSLGDADLLRRAMGKKKPEEMAQQKEKFLLGAKKKKVPLDKAQKIFELMAKFAEYGFNKSHSAAYALVAYYTAYLKTHYTVEFMASLLTHDMSNTDKILLYISEAKEHGIEVLAPDVNASEREFSVEAGGKIRFGLAALKGVGDAAIASIVEERNKDGSFSSIFDFCERVDLRRVNKKVIESLIKCGGFDLLHAERHALVAGIDTAMDWGVKRRRDLQLGQTTMFDLMPQSQAKPQLPKSKPWREPEKLAFEKEALGFYLSGHPLSPYREQIKRLAAFDTSTCQQATDKSEVALCGIVASLKEIRTKKGKRMAFIRLEDTLGALEVVVFNEVYEACVTLLQSEQPIYVTGEVNHHEDTVKILAREILSLEDMRLRKSSSVHLKVEADLMNPKAFQQLKSVLEKHPGRLPIYLHLNKANDKTQAVTVLELPADLHIHLTENFIFDIEQLLGQSAVILN